MLGFFKRKKAPRTPSDNVVFQSLMFVDVTNFAAISPEDSFGYMRSGNVLVMNNGTIEIRADDNNDLIESFSVSDIFRANNNICNFHPNHRTEVALTTEDKNYRFSFQTLEQKRAFWEALSAVHNTAQPT